jgi:LacI family transcriptional regulator
LLRKAGVSRGTVDRVLNNRGKVRPEVEEKVRRIADELGYRPNLLGRALGMNKNHIKIGVIAQAAETLFYESGAERGGGGFSRSGRLRRKRDFEKIGGISAEKTLNAMESMQKQGVKAIAMMPVDDPRVKDKIRQFTGEYQIPIVTFNSDLEDTGRICFVGQHALRCGQTAAVLMGEFFRREAERLL